MDKVKFLKETALFCALDDEELKFLISRLKVVAYEPKEYIFVEGDTADAAYIVIDGHVELIRQVSPEIDKTLFVAGPGMVFGEMGILEKAPRSASAMAQTAVELVWFGTDLFDDIMGEKPSIASKVLSQISRMLSSRLRTTTDMLLESVRWSLEVSGASKLHFKDLLEDAKVLRIGLRSGKELAGRILRTDDLASHDMTIKSVDGEFMVVPYHAIEYLRLGAIPIGTPQPAASSKGMESD